jgi:uncharacterized protein YxjI
MSGMGLLRRDHQPRIRYRMREKLMSIGDDSWIEDAEGDRVYKVDGKAMRMRDTMAVKDRGGAEVAWIQEPLVHLRNTMNVTIGGRHVTVKKKIVSIRDKFLVEVDQGPTYEAHGNLVDHEYQIERDGDEVAWVSKKWFRVRDTYGIEIAEGQDVLLMLCVAVCIDAMTDE